MKKIRLAFVIGSLGNALAGTEKSLLTLIKHLDREKFVPILICLQDCEYFQKRKFACETTCLDLYRMFTPQMFRKRTEVAQHFRESGIEIVQTFFTEAQLLGGGAARLAGTKVIIASRRNLGHAYGLKEKLYLRFANRYPHRFLANSLAVADAVAAGERVPREKIDVIYNGIDPGPVPAAMEGNMDGAKRVVLVANLRGVKSVETLLQAAPEVIAQAPEVRFEIIGDGVDRRHLEQLSNDLNLEQHVILHGSRPDVDSLLEGAVVGVLTSTSEGFSNSILEYMRASLPVVATSVGGNKEVVKRGVTGYLIPPRDPGALAQKLIQLLQDDQLRREMGAAGRELLETRFSLRQMIEAHQNYYRKLVDQASDG